ncbi:MAG: pseudouridine synthase [Polyangiaceae bacterium]|nr:pseudouridine synthase [Polyangiaceae bacterium]
MVRQPIFRYRVEESEALLSAILDASGHSSALAEGRVFVDRVRAAHEMKLVPGQLVEVYAPMVATEQPEILARRGGIVAVGKPPGWSTEPDRAGDQSVVVWLAEKLGLTRAQVFAGSRLDAPVSGVLLLAVDSKATQLLARGKEQQRLRRVYLALVQGKPPASEGSWKFPVHQKSAHSQYQLLKTLPVPSLRHARAEHESAVSLLRLSPVTGRKHQLRLHAAHAKMPIWGDVRNGGARRFTLANGEVHELGRLMLHARSVTLVLEHGEVFQVEASIPPDMQRAWSRLGGFEQDFLKES